MADLLYLRFSTVEQTADAQRADVPAHVLESVRPDHVFTDPGVSGSVPALDREGVRALLAAARPGDAVHVAYFDRLMRPERMAEAEAVISALRERGLSLRAHDFPSVDLCSDDEVTEMVWRILAAVAAMERRRIGRRRDAGIRAAKAEGRHLGRPVSYTEDQAAEVVKLHGEDWSARSIGRVTGLSHSTVRRILAQHDQADGSNDVAHDVAHRSGQAARHLVMIPGACLWELQRAGHVTEEARELVKRGRKVRRGSGFQLELVATSAEHWSLYDLMPAPQSSNDRRAVRLWRSRLPEREAGDLAECPEVPTLGGVQLGVVVDHGQDDGSNPGATPSVAPDRAGPVSVQAIGAALRKGDHKAAGRAASGRPARAGHQVRKDPYGGGVQVRYVADPSVPMGEQMAARTAALDAYADALRGAGYAVVREDLKVRVTR